MLTTELIFLVAILVVAFHRSVGWREVLGILAIVAGLAGFFTSASPAAGTGQPAGRAWVAVSVVTLTCALALVAAARAGPPLVARCRAGAASAVLFAGRKPEASARGAGSG